MPGELKFELGFKIKAASPLVRNLVFFFRSPWLIGRLRFKLGAGWIGPLVDRVGVGSSPFRVGGGLDQAFRRVGSGRGRGRGWVGSGLGRDRVGSGRGRGRAGSGRIGLVCSRLQDGGKVDHEERAVKAAEADVARGDIRFQMAVRWLWVTFIQLVRMVPHTIWKSFLPMRL